MIEHAHYFLAYIAPDSRQLIGLAGSAGVELPAVSISLRERPVDGLAKQIKARWNLRAFVHDILSGLIFEAPSAVIEVDSAFLDFEPARFSALRPTGISIPSLTGSQRSSLVAILPDDDTIRVLLAWTGWAERAQHWMQEDTIDRVAKGNSLRSSKRNNATFQEFARSVAGQMHRAALASGPTEVLCP
jgi:hypothetical protein